MVVTWERRSLLTCNFRKLECENSESVFYVASSIFSSFATCSGCKKG